MKEIIRITGNRNPAHEEIQCYAATRSLSGAGKITHAELRKFAAELMTAIAKACFGFGAKEIGHIKAHLEYETGFLRASTLGSPEDVTVEGSEGSPAERFNIVVNSVVFGLAQDAIRTATEEALESVSSRFGLHEHRAE